MEIEDLPCSLHVALFALITIKLTEIRKMEQFYCFLKLECLQVAKAAEIISCQRSMTLKIV